MIRFFCLSVLLLIALPVAAQPSFPDSVAAILVGTGTVVVETNLSDGMLYDGETLLGPVAAAGFDLAPGVHRLVLREPDVEAWKPRHAEAEVEIRTGETTTVRLDVPLRYRVESFPFGATVSLEKADGEMERLGETPLDLMAEGPLDGTLVVRKTGYTEARQVPDAALDNSYSVVLRPITLAEAGVGEVPLAASKSPNHWIDIAAVGLALGAGAVAIHYKFKGDDAFEVYERSGDPNLRPEIDRYDTYSAVALGAMQVGIGVFAIRLVLR